MNDADIDRARLRAARAKGRLVDGLETLKERLMPRAVARMFLKATKEEASDVAAAGVNAIKAKPALIAGAAGIAALFLARKPIARAISSEPGETPTKAPRSPRKPATRKTVRKGKP